MENVQFRHVSAGALVLVVCALVAALVGAVSVVASEPGYRTAKTRPVEMMRLQGKAFVPVQAPVTPDSRFSVEPAKFIIQN
jgi:poly(3-hydroxybutyrate) depolymerase